MSKKDKVIVEARMSPGYYDYPEEKFWCYQLKECNGQKFVETFSLAEDEIIIKSDLHDSMPFDVSRFEFFTILPNNIEIPCSSQETRILSVLYEGHKCTCQVYGLNEMKLAGVSLGVFEEVWSIVEERVNLLKDRIKN
ncbi:hypothetical protein Pla110_20730 [Polystyrenella longa]|uniref:Uncharacterized protein n=1 Tax=Polystyrenella longa TaxID=2528007 RepID=A0A518CM90_9PLAN|nr:hypothetical protein [Polystyrenella longa]QDU80346.1 hypothetical protein Pla110_20730 [Polystyrenella longa]